MIVQTRRASGFGAVLRGELMHIEAAGDCEVAMVCRGRKAETGALYEFRIVLTLAEAEILTRGAQR